MTQLYTFRTLVLLTVSSFISFLVFAIEGNFQSMIIAILLTITAMDYANYINSQLITMKK